MKTTKTKIDATKNPVAVTALDFEFLRKNQTRTCTRDEVTENLAELAKLACELVPDKRYYYHTTVKMNGTTVLSVWFKRDALRVCVNKTAMEKYHNFFTIDLESRIAMKHESRGSENYIEVPGEYVITMPELLSILTAITTAPAEKVEAEPEKKHAPKKSRKKKAVEEPVEEKSPAEELVDALLEAIA